MRYTKIALLTFGAGLVLGLIVVVAEFNALARLASGLMALGIIGIPFGVVFDLRRATRADRTPTKGAANPPVRRRAAAPPRRAPRSRKPAAPKR